MRDSIAQDDVSSTQSPFHFYLALAANRAWASLFIDLATSLPKVCSLSALTKESSREVSW